MNDSLAVANCPCRIRSRKCDGPLETCLQIGKAAEYALERGTGRQVSKKEAMQILRQTEEAGLVHVTLNKADGMYFICNCCGCCCIALRSLVQYGRIVTDPSRFLAEVDEDACTACGACEESCYFDAIQVQDKESHELAAFVQSEIPKALNTKNRGVNQGPYIVLIGTSMPKILVEVGFISNRGEAKKLKTKKYQKKVAEKIFVGIKKFKEHSEKTVLGGLISNQH